MLKLKSILFLLFALGLYSCNTMYFVPASDDTRPPKNQSSRKTIYDENGNVIVRSGSNRDNRMGYYFDTEEKICKQVFYSSGPGCVPPPYKTLDQCQACRKNIPLNQQL